MEDDRNIPKDTDNVVSGQWQKKAIFNIHVTSAKMKINRRINNIATVISLNIIRITVQIYLLYESIYGSIFGTIKIPAFSKG